jgi:eukaryotic-like serine/threonine-protein kinase
MDDRDPHLDTETVGVAVPGKTPMAQAGSNQDANAEVHNDDLLLNLLERWDESYRRGEDATPESLGVTDPTIRDALRELIKRQKRLYALLDLANTPSDDATTANEPLPPYPDHEIIIEIGRGGMGIVYKARDRKLGRVVAIKTIAEGEYATSDQRERFRAEAQAVARLSHPNIIAIHAIGEHDKRPYLSLEFVEGGSLDHRLAEKPMASREAADLVETLARAVHAAHQAGVVHRDLKPSNVLLTTDGVPKVSDFGLAKLLDSDSARTASGQIMGTPSYMAPEQAEGHSKRVGPAADIYALGAILYQALTGRPPFLGESAIETLKLVTSTEVVAPHLLRPDVPRDLETICLKCLEKAPLKRYASAEALAEDLRRFLDNRPIAARPVGPAGRFGRWSRRNPRVAGLSAAVFVSLILGIGVSTTLAFRAIRAESATRTQRNRAESQAEIAKAVNEFLQKDLLSQAGVGNQATLKSKPDPDLKVRTALDRAAETIGERFAAQPLVEASIRQTIGVTYYHLGLFSQARPHLERAIDLRRRALGAEDPETFSAMLSLGELLEEDGKHDEAERFLVPAMVGLRRTRGEDHAETLVAMIDVGALYLNQGKLEEAETLLSRAIEGARRTRGGVVIEAFQGMCYLAAVYSAKNNHETAERLLNQAIRDLRQELGPENPYTLTAMDFLASFYKTTGKPAQARQLREDILQAQRRVLGNKHPQTLYNMALLAEFYVFEGRNVEAETLLLEALEGCREALDRNHYITDMVLAYLTRIYLGKRELKKAESYLIEALEIARYRYGRDDNLVAQGNSNVGTLLCVEKEYARAEPYLRDRLAWDKTHDPEAQGRFVIESWLGACLLAQKKYPEAETLLLSAYTALKALRKGLPPGNAGDLGRTMDQIIQLYDDLGKKDKVAEWRRERADVVFSDDPFAQP